MIYVLNAYEADYTCALIAVLEGDNDPEQLISEHEEKFKRGYNLLPTDTQYYANLLQLLVDNGFKKLEHKERLC